MDLGTWCEKSTFHVKMIRAFRVVSRVFPSYGREVKIVGIAYRLSEYLV